MLPLPQAWKTPKPVAAADPGPCLYLVISLQWKLSEGQKDKRNLDSGVDGCGLETSFYLCRLGPWPPLSVKWES